MLLAEPRARATACDMCGHPHPNRPIGRYLLCVFCVADLRQLLSVFSPEHAFLFELCEGHVEALGWLVVFYRDLDEVA